MPWSAKDAKSKTKRASSAKKRAAWAATANAVLKRTGDDAKAIRIANSVVKKTKKRKR